jgi:hypothetical protein
MEFVAILFTTVMTFNFWAVWESMDSCRNDIIDIYYPLGKKNLAYDWNCPYTLTPINCSECSTHYIKRSEYDKFAKSYRILKMKPPFPKRTDIVNVYKPKSYN